MALYWCDLCRSRSAATPMNDRLPINRQPTVTAVVAAWNAEKGIARAIDSVLGQSVHDLEVVVVDDGSTDRTSDLVNHLYGRDSRVTLIRLRENGGPARARNTGLLVARGTWIGVLDADDAWRHDRLERLIEVSADRDVIFDNLMGYDHELGIETGALFSRFPSDELTFTNLLEAIPAGRHDYGYLKPLLRRSFLLARGLRYDETLRTNEDIIFYLELLLAGARTYMLDLPLYVYTTQIGARSRRPAKQSNSIPRDEAFRSALERLLAREDVPLAAVKAINRRIAHLHQIASVNAFYHARLHREFFLMLQIALVSPKVCREIVHKLASRLLRRDDLGQ
jgi:glycosyltransferase involved in cell wall biosynthesis